MGGSRAEKEKSRIHVFYFMRARENVGSFIESLSLAQNDHLIELECDFKI